MSTLTVVRHGQARPFQQNADPLSETGEQQARALAEYWSRERHRVRRSPVRIADPPPPDRGARDGPAGANCRRIGMSMTLKASCAAIRRRLRFPDNRAFQKTFETGDGKMAGRSFAKARNFRRRSASGFCAGLRSIQQGPPNRSVVLFTSGGPIGVLVQTALNAPDREFSGSELAGEQLLDQRICFFSGPIVARFV